MILSEINIYPVKSLKGIALNEAAVEERGLRFDRRWMLTDPDGRFLTQREVPRMATVSIEVNRDHLIASAPEAEPLFIPVGSRKDTVRTQTVNIWSSECSAGVYPNEVNEWFSDTLGLTCQLVEMPDMTRRSVDPKFAISGRDDVVSFADGYPFLLIGEASLADLNGRLDEPVPMNRFRPNFVVSDSGAFAEDSWKKVRIGETLFHVVKPCARCVMPTIDQATGEKTGKEPTATLNSYRKVNGNVLFGQNLIADEPGGVVRIGDRVEVVDAA